MPIYKDDTGAVDLDMGVGDAAVCPARMAGAAADDEAISHPGPAGEMGRPADDGVGQASGELGTAVRMLFRRASAVRVLVGVLCDVYAGLPDAAEPAEGRRAAMLAEVERSLAAGGV